MPSCPGSECKFEAASLAKSDLNLQIQGWSRKLPTWLSVIWEFKRSLPTMGMLLASVSTCIYYRYHLGLPLLTLFREIEQRLD